MKPPENIEKLIKNVDINTNAGMDKAVLEDVLKALENSKKKAAVSQPNIRKTNMKTRIAKLTAAAAVIIAVVLIGISLFSNSDQQPSTEIEPAEAKLGMELTSIEQMFKDGNVDGLVAMLSEGEFESKAASADYLAKLGAVEAVEPLEYLRGEYDIYGEDNPFAKAAKEIKKLAAAGKDDMAERITEALAMHTQNQRGNFELGAWSGGELSAGLVRTFQAEAKEVADGYPIKAGGTSITQVVPASMYQNLVLYYSFHVGSDPNTAVDVSGGNFHGQVHGARYAKDEILGGVMSFDGDDDYISIPDIYLEGFTISAWVKTPDPGSINNRRIFMLYDEGHCYAVEGNTRGGISVGAEKIGAKETKTTDVAGETTTTDTDTITLTVAEDSDKISSESGWARSNWAEDAQFSEYDWRFKANTWTHITVTYDGVTGRIYRNGKLKEEGDIPAEGFTGTAYIGGIDRHNGGFWQGILDEVALFNRALSEEEVGQLYLMTGEMIATGPTLTEGASGNGYYFDGDGDYIDVGTISDLGVEQTKMLWIYMEAFPLPHDVYLIDEGGNNNWIELFDSDGNGVPQVRAGFDGGNYFDSDGEIRQEYWYHIAVVSKSTGDVDIYIDGVLDSSRSGFSATNEPQAILIGGDSGTNIASFKGVIDEVAIFNRALADSEIHQIYQNVGRLSGNETGLVGYWNFDADEGDIVKDGSPYHNDGKLSDI
jgi:hypothetical protein